MKKILFCTALFLFLFSSMVVYAAVDVVVLDKTIVRGSGEPITVTHTIYGLSGPAMIKLWNGNATDSTVERVSSSSISLNSTSLFSASDFNQNVDYLEKSITLNTGSNTLSVLLKSKPGGTIRIKVVQTVAGEAERTLPIVAFAGALSQGDTTAALSFVDPDSRAKIAEQLGQLGPAEMKDMASALQNATLVVIRNDYAEYKVPVPLASGEVILTTFTMTKTPDGWKIDQI